MTKMQRASSAFTGLLMIAGAVLFESDPVGALPLIVFIMTLSLFIYGIRLFIYYITLARHMVGGIAILYRAVIVLDLAVFAFSLTKLPLFYVMLYLIVIHGFSGVVNILRSMEARRLMAPAWKLNLFQGALEVAMAVLCLLFIKSTRTAVSIYAAGIFYSGAIRIIQAFRKTESVYVQ